MQFSSTRSNQNRRNALERAAKAFLQAHYILNSWHDVARLIDHRYDASNLVARTNGARIASEKAVR
jgi:hypothetical protein